MPHSHVPNMWPAWPLASHAAGMWRPRSAFAVCHAGRNVESWLCLPLQHSLRQNKHTAHFSTNINRPSVHIYHGSVCPRSFKLPTPIIPHARFLASSKVQHSVRVDSVSRTSFCTIAWLSNFLLDHWHHLDSFSGRIVSISRSGGGRRPTSASEAARHRRKPLAQDFLGGASSRASASSTLPYY